MEVSRLCLGFLPHCRFQELQEFDKEKRSCIRRLEGHNKRRRKTHPNPVESALNKPDNCFMLYLMRTLGNVQGKNLISRCLRNFGGTSLPQQLKNEGTSTGTQTQVSLLMSPSCSDLAKASGSNSIIENSPNIQVSLMGQDLTLPSSSMMQNTNNINMNMESGHERNQRMDIDLNRAQDCEEDLQLIPHPNLANGSVDIPISGEKDPPKAHSDGTVSDSRRSTPSCSSSSGEAAQNQVH